MSASLRVCPSWGGRPFVRSLLAAAEETSHARAGTLQGSTYDECVSRSVYIYIYILLLFFFFLEHVRLEGGPQPCGGSGGLTLGCRAGLPGWVLRLGAAENLCLPRGPLAPGQATPALQPGRVAGGALRALATPHGSCAPGPGALL